MRTVTAGVEDLPHARRATATAVVAGLLVGAGIGSGCGDRSSMAPEGHPVEPVRIVLGAPDGEAGLSTLELVGLSGAQLSAIRDATLTADEWQALFRVSVGASADEVWSLPPVLGAYAVTGDAIRFSPRYGFDAGRDYRVVFDPARFPPRANGLVQAGSWPIIDEAVATPAADVRPPTRVEQVYPSAEVLTGESAALVYPVLWPDGAQGRCGLRPSGRRERPGGRRSVSSAGPGIVEQRSHSVHAPARPGTGQAGHSSQPGAAPGTRGGRRLHARDRSGLARRVRGAAGRIVHLARSRLRHLGTMPSNPPSGNWPCRWPALAIRWWCRFPRRSIMLCCTGRCS